MAIGPQSAWNSAQPYLLGQQVIYGGFIYQALQFVPPGNTPAVDSYWEIVSVPPAPLGAIQHIIFPITYATANLTAGVPVVNVNPGDIIVAAWFEADVAFNGTTPYADWGTFSSTVGVMGELGTVAHLATVDTAITDNAGLYETAAVKDVFTTPLAPIRVSAASTIKICVSETGAIGGTATSSTAGSAVFHMLLAPNPV